MLGKQGAEGGGIPSGGEVAGAVLAEGLPEAFQQAGELGPAGAREERSALARGRGEKRRRAVGGVRTEAVCGRRRGGGGRGGGGRVFSAVRSFGGEGGGECQVRFHGTAGGKAAFAGRGGAVGASEGGGKRGLGLLQAGGELQEGGIAPALSEAGKESG